MTYWVCGLILTALAAAAGVWLRLRKTRSQRAITLISQATFEQSPTGVILLDASTLHIITANTAFLRQTGYAAAELLATPVMRLFDEDASGEALMGRLREPTDHATLKATLRCTDGTTLDVDLIGHRVRIGERRLLSYACHDASLRTRFESRLLEKQQHLDHLAHHDQLTGLPNRLYLAAHLPEALKLAAYNGQILAVLFLDLDRFKHINDSRGHETGDELLKAVAQRLRDTLRGEDIVIRMGGDEFVVIMKSVRDAEDVNEAAQRITQTLSSPIVVDGRPLITTASIGVSLYPRDGADMGELLRHSDTAMYQAKERGRNNCQVFSPFMDRRLKQRIAIETHLRLALETQQLDVHYQPIVEILSNQVVAMEALLRWNHPSHGFISPARFISIAEESGLIVPIGEFVLERVLTDAARWRQEGCKLVPIAVNVSAAQLQRSNLAGVILDLTRKFGMEPTLLQIELTEGTIFERREGRNGEPNEDAVTRLRDLGIHISIDDFGTGYSSLSYLKRWPVDSIKIDRSFVRDLGSDPSDLAIVGAIIAMARHLRIPVIAEGIEGWQQLERLRELGCARVQGHLIAKPASPEKCTRFLQGRALDLTDRRGAMEAQEIIVDWAAQAR
ncbi:MAG TPA: EAL domain-containing protein [Steroidobacteraceae bacterium]|nr:EAL domain-containing protein [Steroidobacteraceae bacterium]